MGGGGKVYVCVCLCRLSKEVRKPPKNGREMMTKDGSRWELFRTRKYVDKGKIR